jgi:hypothetical protein
MKEKEADRARLSGSPGMPGIDRNFCRDPKAIERAENYFLILTSSFLLSFTCSRAAER